MSVELDTFMESLESLLKEREYLLEEIDDIQQESTQRYFALKNAEETIKQLKTTLDQCEEYSKCSNREIKIPKEPTNEILTILYDGLYRLDSKFGKDRARMRYLKMIRFLTTGGSDIKTEENIIYVGADKRFSKEVE